MNKKEVCPSYQMRRFDALRAKQAGFLIAAFAAEECGLLAVKNKGGALHCSTRDHPHLNETPSLQLRASSDERDALCGINCYGRCGCRVRRLSDYLALIGPVGAQTRFWSKERVTRVLGSLEKGEPLELGWLEWKRSQGLPSSGVKVDGARLAVVSSSTLIQSGQRFSARYAAAFLNRDPVYLAAVPAMIDEVSAERGWDPEVVHQLVDERLLALERPAHDPSNVLIHFAYRGFFENPPNVSARIIKPKMLRRKPGEGAVRGFFYDEDVRSLAVADFSAVGVFYQDSPRIAFFEGEPDSCTWRHYGPEDAIVCLGNVHVYRQAIEILPLLKLKDRTVIIGSDRDTTPDGQYEPKNKELVSMLVEGIAAQEPRSILLWMCPKIEGRPCKDLNDFRLAFGPDASPDRFLKPFAFKARERSKVLNGVLTAAFNARVPTPENDKTVTR